MKTRLAIKRLYICLCQHFYRRHLPLIYLCSATAVAADNVYPISPFSEHFNATVTVAGDPTELFKIGHVSVFNQLGEELVRVESDSLVFNLKQNEVGENLRELPYDEQSVLVYDDFNFDGMKDLALMDGQYSCYGGPSYQVYLATKQREFEHSDAFSDVAQRYCGLFTVDHVNRQIHAVTKSGCCWHKYDSYLPQGSQLKLVRSETESLLDTYLRKVVKKYHGETSETAIELYFPTDIMQEYADVILTFALEESMDKRVVVFQVNNRLDYALLNGDEGLVEYSANLAADKRLAWQYLDDAADKDSQPLATPAEFSYKKSGELSFISGNTRYTVVDNTRLGVEVSTGKNTTFLVGNVDSQQGSIRNLMLGHYENVEE